MKRNGGGFHLRKGNVHFSSLFGFRFQGDSLARIINGELTETKYISFGLFVFVFGFVDNMAGSMVSA